MPISKKIYDEYVSILQEELVPAMGCTEPIALAYAGALARDILGKMPDKVELTVSGNIIKNVKSVIVPHTRGGKGIKTAVAVGICYGEAEKKFEVLSNVTDEQLDGLAEYIDNTEIIINKSDSPVPFDIQLRVFNGGDTAFVRIVANHTNVVRTEKNGTVLIDETFSDKPAQPKENKKLLNVKDIVEFANTVDVEDVRETLSRQIQYNMAIADEGMTNDYGANIGKILLGSYGDAVQNKAKAFAAAGSDARMNGCEMPVVINSGSGNQGMTASIPVIIYAQEMGAPEDALYRALVVSNLITIHLKTGIGSLSAYCGATSAGVGAGAGIAYLHGGDERIIEHVIVNAIAINSGMICDGAKASCAAKIASAVEAGLLGWKMILNDSEFHYGDGIVESNVENTINAVSEIAREGMRSTDDEIIQIMINS